MDTYVKCYQAFYTSIRQIC